MPIFTLAKKDLRILLRDTRAAIILLTMPLVFIFVIGLALGDPDERLHIWIVNEDAGLPPNPGPYPGKPWAEVVREAGCVQTKEGATHYRAGDYLVFNEEHGGDAYAVSPDRFEAMYERAEQAGSGPRISE